MDEAQYSGKAGKNVKLLFDLFSDRLKLIVTGSGSFDIKVEVGKYLVGARKSIRVKTCGNGNIHKSQRCV